MFEIVDDDADDDVDDGRQSKMYTPVNSKFTLYQRTNGLVNAHLISGPSKSTKQTRPVNKYEKDLINNS